MNGLDTIKKLNDAASDAKARAAIRRIARKAPVRADALSSCCRAGKTVVGIGRSDAGQTNYYVCDTCHQSCD